MRMDISLSNFPMSQLEHFTRAVNKYAKVEVTTDNAGTVNILCEADMVKCQEVIIIADLYWSGGELNVQEKEE